MKDRIDTRNRTRAEPKPETINYFKLIHLFSVAVGFVGTLRLKSLLPLASVWSKTTINNGGVGGAGADPQI